VRTELLRANLKYLVLEEDKNLLWGELSDQLGMQKARYEHVIRDG